MIIRKDVSNALGRVFIEKGETLPSNEEVQKLLGLRGSGYQFRRYLWSVEVTGRSTPLVTSKKSIKSAKSALGLGVLCSTPE